MSDIELILGVLIAGVLSGAFFTKYLEHIADDYTIYKTWFKE